MHVTVLLGAACTHMVGPDHSSFAHCSLQTLSFVEKKKLERKRMHFIIAKSCDEF